MRNFLGSYNYTTNKFTEFITGVSLRCYSCYSTANFSHCNQNFERVICSPWLDVCAKSHVIFQRWGKEYHAYEHGCFANDFCNTKACKYIGRHYNAQACNITCCDVELCNSGASGSESKMLIAVSLALAAGWGWLQVLAVH